MKILKENNVEFQIMDYLKNPPTVKLLKKLSHLMDLSPKDFIRKKEAVFKELNLAHHLEDNDYLFERMHENPKLIERPIAYNDEKAVLGRPPEKVMTII
ncbi:MAG: arsenate reductase (glutaredoxin) [Candidatus Marinimicrobia bacterium]|nr:arsenate reductase (glutaredoxin) [Candidatus Neomarinimicrobiota bacterium]MBT3633600.1 arsenate reductase (glutaredoxin) [Candidatus Neomarinimicrobiota bacterium]MBT3682447.1 arsenate reductase (glutaredoxin) [Candidatus Neomarinimicrobiota bacterium]MBT3759211.1 arsenate reductase (glutaredoxin) [Candidatus Neomarinimicrobiota bacterium]MBT3895516.1 arsenate reductase (glutaredoxin) [Candidatus Neomarinimicrobiota bacterium]